MTDNEKVSFHYSSGGDLAAKIAEGLQQSGRDLGNLSTRDLSAIDEFHFRGRTATLELAAQMRLSQASSVLDIGCGLGGASRTLVEEYGCRVSGIDLTQAFCDAAEIMSGWVGLAERTEFQQGDATDLPFADYRFDAAITLHVAMNVAAKDRLYAEARRVLKPGGILAVYDILQGEGGDAIFPAPWARDPAISHLASPAEMEKLLAEAGFRILDVHDSTDESLDWIEARTAAMAAAKTPPITTQVLFGDDFADMISNQTLGLRERRIRTVSFICEA
jgi:ubiquinone/menaquinone biosynthesis C-methylase UbiE